MSLNTLKLSRLYDYYKNTIVCSVRIELCSIIITIACVETENYDSLILYLD